MGIPRIRLRNWLISLPLLALSVAWAEPPGQPVAGPGDIGGGGSVIRCDENSPWVLLDRANRNPKLLKESQPTPSTAEAPLSVRIERVDIAQTPAYARAQEILQRWAGNSPDLVNMIRKAMLQAPYLRTSSRIQTVSEYTLNPEITRLCPGAKPVTAIHFLPRYGSIISDPLWGSADLDTQAGLLIHEALRQIQLGYYYRPLDPRANPRNHFTNADVEAITAQIMDGDPTAAPGPQDSPHIRGMLRRELDAQRAFRAAHERAGNFLDTPPNSSEDPCLPPTVTIADIGIAAMLKLVLSHSDSLHDAISFNQFMRDPEQAWRELRRGGLISEPTPP